MTCHLLLVQWYVQYRRQQHINLYTCVSTCYTRLFAGDFPKTFLSSNKYDFSNFFINVSTNVDLSQCRFVKPFAVVFESFCYFTCVPLKLFPSSIESTICLPRERALYFFAPFFYNNLANDQLPFTMFAEAEKNLETIW